MCSKRYRTILNKGRKGGREEDSKLDATGHHCGFRMCPQILWYSFLQVVGPTSPPPEGWLDFMNKAQGAMCDFGDQVLRPSGFHLPHFLSWTLHSGEVGCRVVRNPKERHTWRRTEVSRQWPSEWTLLEKGPPHPSGPLMLAALAHRWTSTSYAVLSQNLHEAAPTDTPLRIAWDSKHLLF